MRLHPAILISRNIKHIDIPCDSVNGICAVTGEYCKCVPFKALFGSNFTEFSILKAPHSGMVGVDTYQALKHKWERYSSWIVTENEFTLLGKSHSGDGWRNEVLKYIFDPPQGPWAGYITTSYKKHGAMRAPVNRGTNVWLFEMILADCTDQEKTREYWEVLNKYLRVGFGRPVLESVKCSSYVIRKCGLSEWVEFERWAKDKYQSGLYKLMCYLLPSQNELKKETGNKQKQKELFSVS